MKLENPLSNDILPRDLVVAAGDRACWRFERNAGEVITRSLKLLPDGRLLGHSHPNEARWGFDDHGGVFLLTRDGRPSSLFDRVDMSSGTTRIVGRYLLEPDKAIEHALVQTRLPVDAPRGGLERSYLAASDLQLIGAVEQAVRGSEDSFDVLRLAKLDAGLTSARYYQERMLKAAVRRDAEELLTMAADHLDVDGLILEFGVASGRTINHIARHFPDRRIYGFDVFTGLPEAWRTGFDRGAFGRADLPTVEPNVELVVGLFDDTLPEFLQRQAGAVALLHVDCDLYSSTVTIFDHLGGRLQAGSLVVFDEYFNYPGWQQHEFMAWQEYCQRSGMRYEYLGFVSSHQQVAVRCLGIVD
jgi:hypothetical protein